MDHTQINMDHIQKNKTGSLALLGGVAAIGAAAGGVAGYVAGRSSERGKNLDRLEQMSRYLTQRYENSLIHDYNDKVRQFWGDDNKYLKYLIKMQERVSEMERERGLQGDQAESPDSRLSDSWSVGSGSSFDPDTLVDQESG